MKRLFLIAALIITCSIATFAQKYALVDMEYILKNIPQYEMANEQLNQVSLRWQKRGRDENERSGNALQKLPGRYGFPNR